MQKTDKYFVGYEPEVKAVKKGGKDEYGNILLEGREAVPENPGIEVNIKLPIPFEVLLKASEFVDGTVTGLCKTGEIVARACAVGGIPKDVEVDGQLMMALCMECSKYVDAKGIKKNS